MYLERAGWEGTARFIASRRRLRGGATEAMSRRDGGERMDALVLCLELLDSLVGEIKVSLDVVVDLERGSHTEDKNRCSVSSHRIMEP